MDSTVRRSDTFVYYFFYSINKRDDFDYILAECYHNWFGKFKIFLAFWECLLSYDVIVIPFSGFFLGETPFWWLEAHFFKAAKIKVICIPYGSDSYVYRNIRSVSWLHALQISYPEASRAQDKIDRKVRYWVKNADFILNGIMGPDGFGRWDVLLASGLFIDTSTWRKSNRSSSADGTNDTVFLAHTPNHRGCKGTEFILEAVDQLREEGLKVELFLLEKLQNEEVKEIFSSKVDILVEQIIAIGHGLSALEGMASGLPVISNLEDETYTLQFRRWSYFSECPIVSATPENIKEIIRKLVINPELRRKLGQAGRSYVEKYHGLDSSRYLFTEIIKYLYGRRGSLINLYHPLLGEFPRRTPKVEHPLVNNHIVEEG